MDIFKKCYDYTDVAEAKATGLYPYFHALETPQDTEVTMDGKTYHNDRLKQLHGAEQTMYALQKLPRML